MHKALMNVAVLQKRSDLKESFARQERSAKQQLMDT